MQRFNGWLTIFWIAMISVSIALGLLSSVIYVSALSLWALVSGHWSAWQPARVEVAQLAQEKELADNPVEDRVVDQLIERTNVSPDPTDPSTATATPSTLEGKVDAVAAQLAELRRYLESEPPRPA